MSLPVKQTNLNNGGPRSKAGNLTDALKALLHLAQEQGQLTYDDVNDILPDDVAPDDLDALYSKLQGLGIEVVAHFEVEKAKFQEGPEEDRRLDPLDDPLRMYMKQMGKVALLTREQEVELCQRIEAAEL